MFIAILEKTRRGKKERFTATLRITGESRGSGEPRWRWSDLYIDGGGESYNVSKRTYKTQDAACKALLKEYPKATIGIE